MQLQLRLPINTSVQCKYQKKKKKKKKIYNPEENETLTLTGVEIQKCLPEMKKCGEKGKIEEEKNCKERIGGDREWIDLRRIVEGEGGRERKRKKYRGRERMNG